MMTVTAQATAHLQLHHEIEIEVEEDATEEEITKKLEEEARMVFEYEVVLGNGLTVDIEVDEIEQHHDV